MTPQVASTNEGDEPDSDRPPRDRHAATNVDPVLSSDRVANEAVGLVTNSSRIPWYRVGRRRPLFGDTVFWPLVILVLIGVMLRALVSVAAWPTMFEWVDAVRFARVYPTGLLHDFWMPAGYPVFLTALHLLSRDIGFTIAVQHLLGVVTAVLLYLVARRLGVGRWVSLVPAAVVLLSGDQIYLEHIMMGDTFYLFAMVSALYLFVRALQSSATRLTLAIAGVVSGLACLTRATAIVVLVVMIIWLLASRANESRRCKVGSRRATWFVLPAVGVVVGYIGIASAVGPYSGMFDMGGFDLYARVAPFANCRAFAPPSDTEKLCELAPTGSRLGPEHYAWDLTSPVRRSFQLSPATSRVVGRFATDAILHEPGAYLKAVLVDMARYVDPSIVVRPAGYGEGHNLVSFSDFNQATERHISAILSDRYSGTSVPSTRWLADLASGQRILRVGRVVMLVFLASVCGGLIVGRGRLRFELVAISAMTILLFLVPVATFTYDVRYGVPPEAFLGLAAALGLERILAVLQQRRQRIYLNGGSGSESQDLVKGEG